jgi:TolA-binding protein
MPFSKYFGNIFSKKAVFLILFIIIMIQLIISDVSLFAETKTASPSLLTSQQDNRSKKELEVLANKIYDAGIRLFKKGEYWNCAQELIIVMDFFPEFSQMDKVVNYLGHCLFQEELNFASIRMFNYLLKNYKQSKHVPDALLGLERAFYQQKEYKQALRVYYAVLKNPARYKNILDEARYLAGKCHYHLKNYDIAVRILKKVDNHNKFYDSALYTTALSYLKNSNVAVAVDHFQKITSLPIINAERRNIVDDARLTLGLIYYELNAYQAAIYQLLKISSNHEHYQDALLGLGWAYLKLADFNNVIKYLNRLINNFPDTANAEESYFLLGQAYMAHRQYDESLTAYRTIIDLYPEKKNILGLLLKVNNSLRQEENRVEELKVKILVEETKLLDAMPLIEAGKEIPKYLINKKKELKDFREKMIANLLNERDHLLFMQRNIDELTKLVQRKELRKEWRSYAEYGISRALFLQEMSTLRGN